MRPLTGLEPHRTDVLARLLAGDEVDIQSLVSDTGLSASTVVRSVDELMNVHGMVENRPTAQSRPGRPGRRLAVNRRFSLVAGVDLGGTNCRIVLADALGKPIAKTRLATPIDLGAEAFAEWLAAHIHALVNEFGEGAPLGSVGIGVPGAVSSERDRVVGSLNVPAIVGTTFMTRVQRGLGVPVRFDNDSSLALLGELSYGATPRADTTVLLILGTGISAAAAVHGEILSGAEGSLGEFGRLPLPGRRALVRDLLSGGGLPTYAQRQGYAMTSSRELLLEPEKFAALRTEIDETLEHVLAVIALAYEPKKILLSGGFSDLFGTQTLADISARVRSSTLVDCAVTASSLRDDSGLLGAMALGVLALYQEHGVEAVQLAGLPGAATVADELHAAPAAAH